jgi:hypothetical protein
LPLERFLKKQFRGFLIASMWWIAACASAPGIDRPVPLDAGYAARELGASKPSDRCGPEFISDHLPKSIVSLMGPVLDGSFRPVCARHDACYELREQTQAWCDDRMHTEMLDICNANRSETSAGAALCRMRARLYFNMVDNTYGAYSYHGSAGGEIAGVDVMDAPKGELEVCVTARNTTPLLQEYIVELRSGDGRRIARAPVAGERSVRAGETGTLCLGTTASAYWNLRRIASPVTIRLLADDPDSLAMANDIVVVTEQPLDLPDAPKG